MKNPVFVSRETESLSALPVPGLESPGHIFAGGNRQIEKPDTGTTGQGLEQKRAPGQHRGNLPLQEWLVKYPVNGLAPLLNFPKHGRGIH